MIRTALGLALVGIVLVSVTVSVVVLSRSAVAGSFPFVRVANSGFPTEPQRGVRKPFDILAADMDIDGDPDLLINWHHRGFLELYENQGGKFARLNSPGDDHSGIYDNRGIPELFDNADAMSRRIESSGRSGLFVWHDRNRAGSWRFFWKNPSEKFDGLRLQVEASLGVAGTPGLAESEIVRIDARRLLISLPKAAKQRSFAVRVPRVATQLVVRPVSTPGSDLPPIFVGPQLTKAAAGELELWKPDPHGVAWVDVEGSPAPEIFITRGALAGELRPPARPREDRYYVAETAEPIRYRRAPKGTVPESFGRGRRVEWVDVDVDGTLDLSISCEKSPNSLLVRDPKTGDYRDRAADWGLDVEGAAVQAWGDLNSDGRPDLFYLDGNQIHVMQNRRDEQFDYLRGKTLGLVLPEAQPGLEIIKSTSIRFSDFDNDGDMDLWVLSYGGEMTIALFRNDEARFKNVSKELGLDETKGARVVVLLDVDNDGFGDAVSFGQQSVLWTNLAGRSFRADPFPAEIEPAPTFAATSLDIDGDGWVDLVSAGKQRFLFRNTSGDSSGDSSGPSSGPSSKSGNQYFDVALQSDGQASVGALVRAHFSDGTIRAQRWGSTQSTAYSQAVGPLHFGIRKGVSIEKVGVQWPGDETEVLHDLPDGGTRMSISRSR